MINSHAAEAIRQQRRDALLSQAVDHRLVRSARQERRTADSRTNPESSREPTAEPTRVRRLVRRLAWGAR
jgi:hypothetical protein